MEQKKFAYSCRQSSGKQMVNMSGTGPGYSQTIIITPYMHSLVYHVPVMLHNHGSLKMFSGQGVYLHFIL